jgi:TonB family protein
VTLGPLVAGSAIEIDGKPVATFAHGATEYSVLLSRGQHALAVRAPGHVANEFAFRVGWSGLRRHVTLAQVPDVACVTLTGPPSPTVTVGASWPDHPIQNEFCAPVGTQAAAEWRPDATQPPVRQAFQYTNDGDVVALTQAAASNATESASGAQAGGGSAQAIPGASVAAGQQEVESALGRAQAFYQHGQYKAAIAECDGAIRLDPSNKRAVQLRTQIQQTMQVLGNKSQAEARAPGRRRDEGAKTAAAPAPGSTGDAGTVYRVGNGVSAPSILYKEEPEYTEQARNAKLNGMVLLNLEIDPSGRARNVRVLRGLGLGLDENAVAAIGKWRFRPGYKDGRPVTTSVQIAVRFRLR